MIVHQLFGRLCSVISFSRLLKMPWPSSSPSNVVEVVFCRTKCDKMAVIHQDYYFHHNRKYKGGDYWCCAQRGCKVRLISSRVNHETGQMEFSRRNKTIQHHHPPNAPNLIEKEFRRQLVTQFDRISADENGTPQVATAASVRFVYDKLRRQAIERGVPESLIPSFWNVRSTMYRIRRKRELLGTINNPDSENRENNGTSAGEGSIRSGSSAPESPGSSIGVSASCPEQTEPLCLVTWKKSNSLEEEKHSHRGSTSHVSPILFQTLQPSSVSPFPPDVYHQHQSNIFQPTNQSEALNLSLMPIDPNLLRYSSNVSPSYSAAFQTGGSGVLQHYAAMHAEYLRSLIALNFYPHL